MRCTENIPVRTGEKRRISGLYANEKVDPEEVRQVFKAVIVATINSGGNSKLQSKSNYIACEE